MNIIDIIVMYIIDIIVMDIIYILDIMDTLEIMMTWIALSALELVKF